MRYWMICTSVKSSEAPKVKGDPMFKFQFRFPLLGIAVAVAAALVLAHFTMPQSWIIMGLYLILVMISAGLSVGYSEGVWDAVRSRKPGMAAIYTVGAFLPWVALLALCITAIMVRSGQGAWLRSTPVISVYLSLFILSGVLQMASPGALDGKVPRSNWMKVGFAIGGGIIAAILLIVFGVDAI